MASHSASLEDVKTAVLGLLVILQVRVCAVPFSREVCGQLLFLLDTALLVSVSWEPGVVGVLLAAVGTVWILAYRLPVWNLLI